MSTHFKKCVSFSYDLTTILVSIADVSTDIIVLVSFYYKERVTFFALSLTILIIAHVAYSFTFLLRYHIGDACNNECCWFAMFLLLLPFGSLISFFIYFTDNPNSSFSSKLHDITGLDMENTIAINHQNKSSSKMTQWMIKKLSKHMGFIMEAGLEAIPQSLLQIVAIVYYKEANYISIISIFLSMFSVMTKSLVFSQGIDINTYIWTWLCIVVDFFGIFFTLTWVFYANNTLLQPVFLGYFTVIGQMWVYKITISIIPIILCAIIWWFFYKMWVIIKHDWTYTASWFTNLCSTVFYACGGSFGVLMAGAVGAIALEIFCFSFFALILFFASTKRWTDYRNSTVSETVNAFIHFVAKARLCNNSNDRMLRLIAINRHIHNNGQLIKYLDIVENNGGIQALQKISYRNIGNNCGNEQRQRNARIYPLILEMIGDISPKPQDRNWRNWLCDNDEYPLKKRMKNCGMALGFMIALILSVIFIISKIFQIMFPYILISYLFYWAHWNEIDTFQMVMLLTYIGLQIVLFLFGIIVIRIHWWLWYIAPGDNVHLSSVKNATDLMQQVQKDYVQMAWLPIIEKMITDKYGDDIGTVIMNFFNSIEEDEIQKLQNHKEI